MVASALMQTLLYKKGALLAAQSGCSFCMMAANFDANFAILQLKSKLSDAHTLLNKRLPPFSTANAQEQC